MTRCSNSSAAFYLLLSSFTFFIISHHVCQAFMGRAQVFGKSRLSSVAYRTNTENDVFDTTTSTSPSSPSTPAAVESYLWGSPSDHHSPINGLEKKNGKHQPQLHNGKHQPPSFPRFVPEETLRVADLAQKLETHQNTDPAMVEFVPSEDYMEHPKIGEIEVDADGHYPFAAMLQGSAPYIASHTGEIAVFYIPGEWLHKPNQLFDRFLQDVALARLLGMKIVLVADCRMQADIGCQQEGFEYAHECHNSLRVTPADGIRQMEEEAGYVRFEVERKLNRFLKMHLASGAGEEGNVVGGSSFYSARAFGKINGKDFQHTGFVKHVYADNIQQALDNNDVVLLTTVGCSNHGDSVNVNGHHLAATVAAELNAYKLIYMSNQGSVLSQRGEASQKFFQEVPLSFVKQLTDYHQVKVHKTGFANFERARQTLEPRAVELLLNLAWGSYALELGVTRAHVVNPKDGALLEELFTSKNGANTCLYHDDETMGEDDDKNWMSDEDAADWNAFFAEAAAQERQLGGE